MSRLCDASNIEKACVIQDFRAVLFMVLAQDTMQAIRSYHACHLLAGMSLRGTHAILIWKNFLVSSQKGLNELAATFEE